MNRLFEISQILASVALLGGLILVYWELREARELNQSQLVVSAFEYNQQNVNRRIGEVPTAQIFVKGCLTPKTLTDEEAYIFRWLMNADRGQANLSRLAYQSGGYEGWEETSRMFLRTFLGTKAGMYAYHEMRLDPESHAMAEDIIAAGEVIDCASDLSRYLDAMRVDQPWWEEASK